MRRSLCKVCPKLWHLNEANCSLADPATQRNVKAKPMHRHRCGCGPCVRTVRRAVAIAVVE
jgi:hypothetical protein